jgi:hypothetical protein
MTMRPARWVRALGAAALCTTLAGACGQGSAPAGDHHPRRDSSTIHRLTAAAESVAAARDEWNRAEVVRRLTEAGLVVTDSGATVHQPGLHPPGTLLDVGGYELQIYLYHDTLTRAADGRTLDTAHVAPRTAGAAAAGRPWIIPSGNLLAVLFTPKEQVAERISNALTARHLGVGR